jgi:predicted regulator of Ras-like GTPase activity (Roadblock/LC7/MglB family)
MAKIEQLLSQMRNEMGPEFLAADVIGVDGLSIANCSGDGAYDSNAASARLAMVMKLAARVSDKLGLGAVEDNLATSDQIMLISRALGDGSYFLGVAVAKDATLGSVRLIMNEYAPQIWDAIPR